ncbi:MAG TPA: glycosyltransferase [Campylobacterales bacterium]|nr:glycosyltransferase [Campylobacterales bacterium]
MRVAIIVLNLDIGGTQRVGVDLANAFYASKNDVHLITFGKKEIKLLPHKNILIHRFNMQESLKKTLMAIPFLIIAKIINMFLRKSFFIFNGLMMSLLFKYKFKKLEKKYGRFDLIIFRGNSVYELVWPLKDKRILQAIDNMDVKESTSLYEKVHAKLTLSDKNIVPISKEIEERVKDLIENESIKLHSLHTIYGPLNEENILKLSLKYKPDIDSKYIVSIGRLAKVKNFELLIETYKFAYENLALRHKLVIVGGGDREDALKELVSSYNLNEVILFTGSLNNPYPWLKGAELFVTTSLSEGLGMTVLEALACRVKVVSTQSKGGVKEIMHSELREYMIEFSAQKLAQKIVETINETKEWDYEKFTHNFSPEVIVGEYQKLYYDKINS